MSQMREYEATSLVLKANNIQLMSIDQQSLPYNPFRNDRDLSGHPTIELSTITDYDNFGFSSVIIGTVLGVPSASDYTTLIWPSWE